MGDDVRYKLTADNKAAIAAMKEWYMELDRVDSKIREFDISVQSAGKSGGKMKDTAGVFSQIGGNIKNILPDIGKMAAGFTSAQSIMWMFHKAVQAVRAEFEDLKRKGTDAANAMLSFEEGSIKATGLGNIAAGKLGIYQSAVKQAAGETGRTTDILNAMGIAYREGLPATSPEQQIDVMKRIAPLTTAAGGVEAAQRMMRSAGTLQRVMPDWKPEDTADLAVMLEAAGADIEAKDSAARVIEQLITFGWESDRAVSLAMTALKKKYGGKGLGGMAGMLTKEIKEPGPPPFGQYLTDEQEIQKELAPMTGEQRLQWLSKEENRAKAQLYFGQQYFKAAPILTQADIAETDRDIARIRTTDIAGEYARDRQGLPLTESRGRGEQIVEERKFSNVQRAWISESREALGRLMLQDTSSSLRRNWTLGQLDLVTAANDEGFFPTAKRIIEERLLPEIPTHTVSYPYSGIPVPAGIRTGGVMANPLYSEKDVKSWQAMLDLLKNNEKNMQKSIEMQQKQLEATQENTAAIKQRTPPFGFIPGGE